MRLTVLFLALSAGAAQAKCALPHAFVLPAEGSVLPPNPQLYLFVPERGEETASPELEVSSADGAVLPFVLERLVDGTNFDVYRLSIRAAAGAQLLVRPYQTKLSSVAPSEKATALHIERGPERNYRWTCSHESTRVIVPSLEAPAFRVTYAEELRDVDAGDARSVILPGRHAWFGNVADAQRQLRLGHPNCAFTNLEWSKPIFVRITALMADGTEVRSNEVLRLDPPPTELGTK